MRFYLVLPLKMSSLTTPLLNTKQLSPIFIETEPVSQDRQLISH
jgi:hypothetical protein